MKTTMVVKIIELMGSSSTSWEEATNEAIKKASETVKNIHSVDVLGFKAMVRDNKISEFRAHVKVAFKVD